MTCAFASIRKMFILFLFLGVAACGGGNLNRPAVETGKPETNGLAGRNGSINVAMLLPLTGSYAEVSKSMQRAAQMAVLEIRNKKLNVLFFDTGGTPEGAVAAIEKAIAGGAKLVIGPLFRETVAAVKERATEADLNIVAFSNSESVAGDNVFLLSFLLRQQVDRIVQHAAENGVNEIGVLAPESVTGERIVIYAKEAAARHGATIARIGYYSGDVPQMTAQINTFATDQSFTGVLIHAGGSRLRTLVSFLAFNDVLQPEVRYLGTSLWEHSSIWTESNLRGGWFATTDPEARGRFVDRYEQIFKEKPVRLASLAYDAIALAAALARNVNHAETNPYTKDALTAARGCFGSAALIRFTKNGLIERGLAVLEVAADEVKGIGLPCRAFIIPSK